MFKLLWRIWWLPYGLAVRHRSWLSHCPGVGTALRCGWAAVPFLLVAWTLEAAGVTLPPLDAWAIRLAWFVFCGLCVADATHLIADLTWSALVKWGRKRRCHQK